MTTKTVTRKINRALTPKLQARRDALEAKGYSFKQDANGLWSAVHADDNNTDTLRFYFKRRNISQCFDDCEKYEKEHNQSPAEKWRYDEISVALILSSQTGAQAIRRKQLTDANIAQLVPSVTENGILEPVLLRPLGNKFELIAGERRWRAATIAGFEKIPAMIADINDEEVVNVQYHENSQRTEPDVLIEAETFRYMRDNLRYTLEEIADHAKKDKSYVEKSLRLALLPDHIKEAFEREEIRKGHLFEIARHPEKDHAEIYSYCFSNFGHSSQALFPLAKAKQQIAQFYLLQLDKATFPLDSKELRADGATCLICPETTKGQPGLYDDEDYAKKNCCLNRECFERKTRNFVEIQRTRTAAKIYNFPAKTATDPSLNPVPVITKKDYLAPDTVVSVSEPILTRHDYVAVKQGECRFATAAVSADRDDAGQIEYICKNHHCPVHGAKKEAAEQAVPPPQSLEAINVRLEEKEKQFEIEVAEATGREIILLCAEKFEAEDDFFATPSGIHFLARLWSLQLSANAPIGREIAKILRLTGDDLATDARLPLEIYLNDLARLPENCRRRLLFLLVYYPEHTPVDIDILCETYGIHQRYTEAQMCLRLAPENRQKFFHEYLLKIENGATEAVRPFAYKRMEL